MAIPSNYKQELIKILNYFKEKYGTDIVLRTGYDKIRNNYYTIISDKTSSLYLNPKFSIELHILNLLMFFMMLVLHLQQKLMLNML